MKRENQIAAAKYLQKKNGDYFPFRMKVSHTKCEKINKMLN